VRPVFNYDTPFREQMDPVSWGSLGIAVFEVVRGIATSGKFSHQSSTVNYMHPNSPPESKLPFTLVSKELLMQAWSPRYLVGGWNKFWFRLNYQRNGYDLRDIQIIALVDKSSSMYVSEFAISWAGEKLSQELDPIAAVKFSIQGTWDPVGSGYVSFWGELLLKSNGYIQFSVSSEKKWVEHVGIY
jgi:hypothetical protein